MARPDPPGVDPLGETWVPWCDEREHNCHRHFFAQLVAIRNQLDRIEKQQEKIVMSQSDIDAQTAQIEATETDLAAAATNVAAEIAALEAQVAANQPVNLDALKAAVAALPGVQAAIDALETPAPAGP